MRGMMASMLVPVWLGLATAAAQLPPEIMADRYLVRVERLMAEKNHEAALEMMDKIVALQKEHNLTLPAEFHFKYAQIAFSAGSTRDAIDSLNKYLAAAGREGRFYREALNLLDEAEQIIHQAEQERRLVAGILQQYGLAFDRLLSEKKINEAYQIKKSIAKLQQKYNFPLPDEFHFKYARLFLLSGPLTAAVDSANKYLGAVGESGQFYKEARELLDKAEWVGKQIVLPLEPAMVRIPAGSFRMGCRNDCDMRTVFDRRSKFRAKPVHKVKIRSFELAKYEVTNEEYWRFRAATEANFSIGLNRLQGQGSHARMPVVYVSWKDAVAYTEWLSAKTGKRYRLPSEAEWEYAARAGSTTKYSWGNEIGHNRASCDACGSKWDKEDIAPVGSFSPNAWGLYDMHGNVAEWVQDCWNEDYRGAPTDGSAWETGDCSQRVIRSRRFDSVSRAEPDLIRSASRGDASSSDKSFSRGLRVARTLTP